MKAIYLIRHGEIEGENPRKFIGRTDLPLTNRGRQQLGALRDHLSVQSFERVVCSPLMRCKESADILFASSKLTIESEQDFSEIDLGDWEGLTVAEVKTRFPGAYGARGLNLPGYRTSHGESFIDLLARVWPALLALIETTTSQTALVAHAGVNRVLLCHILGISLSHMFRLQQDYGCYNVIYVGENGMRVGCVNCLPSQ